MTIGFTSYNESGSIQFDTTNQNYVLVKSGTSYTSIVGNNVYQGFITITNAINPILALKGSGIGFYRVGQSGSTWTFYITLDSINGYSFQGYYIFDQISSTAITTGMVIYNSTGGVIYSSERFPLRLSDFGVTPDATYPPSTTTTTTIIGLDTSKSYASILCSPRRYGRATPVYRYNPPLLVAWNVILWVDIVNTTTSGQISISFTNYNRYYVDALVDPNPPIKTYGSIAGGTFLAVDVTNYPTTYN